MEQSYQTPTQVAASSWDKSPRKVLIVGPSTCNTVASVARAFERLGWRPVLQPYRLVNSVPYLRLVALISRLKLRAWWEAMLFNRFVRNTVWPALDAQPPQLILFFRPLALTRANQARLSAVGVPVVTWATDSLSRYGRYAARWTFATRNYVFDGADECAGSSTWVPLGFDDELFQPVESQEWDILFVGRLFVRLYDLRKRFFERLLSWEALSHHRVAWAGAASRQLKPLVNLAKQRGVVTWGDLDMPTLAKAIATSKICVLVHQDDGAQPVNPLLFAIAGCRSCLVTDRRDYLQRWLVPHRDFVPVGLEDFHAQLYLLTQHPRTCTAIAEQGFQAAQQHTWLRRVATLLADLGVHAGQANR